MHHFVDDADLHFFNKSIKKLTRLAKLDMKHLAAWINDKKNSLNLQKMNW